MARGIDLHHRYFAVVSEIQMAQMDAEEWNCILFTPADHEPVPDLSPNQVSSLLSEWKRVS